MVREPDQLVRLTRLHRELGLDVAAMRDRAGEIEAIVAQHSDFSTLDRPRLVLVAVNLHGWYTALETGLERVARLFDQSVPSSPNWHAELMAQMLMDVPKLRPALLLASAAEALAELRKFRHFFRNAYVLELDPTRVRARVADLESVHAGAMTTLGAFLEHVQRTLELLNS